MIENCLNDALQILEDFEIPNSDNAYSTRREPIRPSLIALDVLRFIVLAAIDFDAEANSRAIKI